MSCVSAFLLGQGGEVKVQSGQEWESRERERKKGKKEGQWEGDRSPKGDLGSGDANLRDVALA